MNNVQSEYTLSGNTVKRRKTFRSHDLALEYRRRDTLRRTWWVIVGAGAAGLLVASVLIVQMRHFNLADRADQQAATRQRLMQSDDLAGAVAVYRQLVLDEPQGIGPHSDLAGALLKLGKTAEATDAYSAVAEMAQRDIASRYQLAWLAVLRYDWEEVERRGDQIQRLAPDQPQAETVSLVLRMHRAIDSGDRARVDALAEEAKVLSDGKPSDMLARWVLIEALRSSADPYQAIPELDAAIALAPRLTELRDMKLSVYSRAGDAVRAGAMLKELHATFPDSANYATWLEQWFVAGSDVAAALQMLRAIDIMSGGAEDASQRRVDFAMNQLGPEAAAVELARLVAAAPEGENADNYRAQIAQVTFDAGRRGGAVRMLEEILATAKPSDGSRRIKLQLVGYLMQSGGIVEARSRVHEILAEDPGNVEALKLEAAWLISDGDPGQARAKLTIAANQAANDVKVVTLLADAFRAEGAVVMEGEKRRLAVSISDFGSEESVLLYQYLMRVGRTEIATQVLTRAHDKHPEDISLLKVLAEDAIYRFNWKDANNHIARITASGQTGSPATASALIRMRNAASARAGSISALMDDLALNAGIERSSSLALLRRQIDQSRLSDAVQTVTQMISADRTDQLLSLLLFWLQASQGLLPEAVATLATLPQQTSQTDAASAQLYELLIEQGKPREASDLLRRALVQRPNATELQRLRAAEVACEGQSNPAIAVEKLTPDVDLEDMTALAATGVPLSDNSAEGLSRRCPSDAP